MRTTLDRIKKNRLMINSIVNNYLLADQNLKLFKHLIDNKKLLGRWQNLYSENGANSLRFTLYMSILSEMRAIMFDQHKKVASVYQIIKTLKDNQFVEKLKLWFCDVDDEEIISADGSLTESCIETLKCSEHLRKTKAFDELLMSALCAYQELIDNGGQQ